MSSGRRSTTALCALLLAVSSSTYNRVASFTPPAFTTSTRSSSSQQTFLVPPDVPIEHLDAAHQAFQHGLDAAMAHIDLHGGVHHGFESTTQLVADAADATAGAMSDAMDAAAAEEVGGIKGAWMSYLQIFKNTLVAVHSAIDGPLRSVGFTQTWGVSIFVFTAMIRSLLLPISIQQSKNTEYTKALKPYIDQIGEKFKDNVDAKNRAVGKLYEDTDQNPLAGCATSLLQLPVFLGLYRGVRLLAMDGELKGPFLFLPTLEGPVSAPTYRGLDWLTQGWTVPDGGGLPVPEAGWENILPFLVMPVVLVLMQSVTMRVLSPQTVDDNMSDEEKEQVEKTQGFLKFLPLMIGFFSLQVPAGLTIYWFTSNIFTLSQSLAVRAYFKANPPKIELPEYWDKALSSDEKDFDDMTPDERRAAVEAGIRIGPSLEDLEDEAKFHSLIVRTPLRADSEAWQRAMASSSVKVPPELEEWVKSSGHSAAAATSKSDKGPVKAAA